MASLNHIVDGYTFEHLKLDRIKHYFYDPYCLDPWGRFDRSNIRFNRQIKIKNLPKKLAKELKAEMTEIINPIAPIVEIECLSNIFTEKRLIVTLPSFREAFDVCNRLNNTFYNGALLSFDFRQNPSEEYCIANVDLKSIQQTKPRPRYHPNEDYIAKMSNYRQLLIDNKLSIEDPFHGTAAYREAGPELKIEYKKPSQKLIINNPIWSVVAIKQRLENLQNFEKFFYAENCKRYVINFLTVEDAVNAYLTLKAERPDSRIHFAEIPGINC